MRAVSALAAIGLGLLVLAEPASAQRYRPELPPYEAITIVRSMGLRPVGHPMLRGFDVVVHAYDRYDRPVRVVLDSRSGRVIAARPVMREQPPARIVRADPYDRRSRLYRNDLPDDDPVFPDDDDDYFNDAPPPRPPRVIQSPRAPAPPRSAAVNPNANPAKPPAPRPRPESERTVAAPPPPAVSAPPPQSEQPTASTPRSVTPPVAPPQKTPTAPVPVAPYD